jgi:predicted nucleic acid-binding protein
MQYLVDTGVLLRLFDRKDPVHEDVRVALRWLRAQGHSFAIGTQNVSEFWNVSTRPVTARGGYGQSVETTERRVQFLEQQTTVLVETAEVYEHWRELLVGHALQGIAVHDARLVAVMTASGITHIVTLNGKDFARYPDIVAVSPQDLAAAARQSQ